MASTTFGLRAATIGALVVSLAAIEACRGSPAAGPSPVPAPATDGANAQRYAQLVRTARSHLDSGNVARALDLAAVAAQEQPDRPEAFVVWGRALASQNDLARAAERYERARTLGGTTRELFVELASVYDVARQYERAIAVYRDWLARNPRDAEMLQELGLTLLLVERFADAAATLREAVRLAPEDVQLQQDLGYALLRAHDLEGATTALEGVVATAPTRVEALRLLAQARAAQGRTSDALSLLDRALAVDAGDVRARRVRARLRQLLADDAGALADYERLLAVEPADAAALLGAAGALAALDRTAAAEPLVAKARATLGDLPEVRAREAQLAWRRGERGAVTTLRTLAESLPNASEIWRDLARAAARFGDRRLATEARRRLSTRP